MTEISAKQRVVGFDECLLPPNENALHRVVKLPIVNSTWSFMQSYYNSMKEAYPTVMPYLEAAETLTSTAANIALVTSKPVVDKFGPSFNDYANRGLDTLEDKVPIILKQPDEILKETKSTAGSILTSPVDNALSATERYVDYYLPSDEEDHAYDSDDSSTTCEEEELNGSKKAGDRIRDISNKVRRRSYKHAMKRWHGIHVRSQEALSKLNFTVDLIQYAHNGISATSATLQNSASLANDTVHKGLETARSNWKTTTNMLNDMDGTILTHAQNLTKQLNATCATAVSYVADIPQLQHLLEKARNAKEATEELYTMFANKTSVSQLSVSVVEAARPKMKLVEDALLQILEKLVDHPPMKWLAPDCDVDPLGGLVMEEIEAQLYGPPRDHDNGGAPPQPRSRSPSGDRRQG
uniref:Perilipin-2 n=1 Tax=Phallusia mammillata TaxID=59560 RepID=A0A6F9DP87_9ASCI|nr:perilipin-2 [Phallusia mammillata]